MEDLTSQIVKGKKYKYRVLNIIGRGSYGVVYKVIRIDNGDFFAMKCVPKDVFQRNPKLVERVEEEIRIQCRIDHPFILKMYQSFYYKNIICVILELCQEDLNKKMKESVEFFTETKVRKIIGQLVEGLIYLHANNIAHRDLSLSNLLLDKDENIKISDFGMATKMNEEAGHRTVCGTTAFMGPEVANREIQTLEVDLWSLGCILYVALVHESPFKVPNPLALRQKDIKYYLPNDISPEGSSLIKALLQRRPEDRMKLTDILNHDFMKGYVPRFQIAKGSYISIDSGKESCTLLTDFTDATNNSAKSARDIPRGRPPTALNTQKHAAARSHSQNTSRSNRPHNQTSYSNDSGFSTDRLTDQSSQSPNVNQSNYSSGIASQKSFARPDGPPTDQRARHVVAVMDSHKKRSHSVEASPCLQAVAIKPVDDGSAMKGDSDDGPGPALSSKFLRPTRQPTESCVVTITSERLVCLETIKKVKKELGEVKCVKFLLFGKHFRKMELKIDEPVVRFDDSTVDWEVYSHDQLPEKLWKKYRSAYKVIDVLRSKTALLSWNTPSARFTLMVKDGYFKATYTDGVVVYISESIFTMWTRDKHKIVFQIDNPSPFLDQDLKDKYKNALMHFENIFNPYKEFIFKLSTAVGEPVAISSTKELLINPVTHDRFLGTVHPVTPIVGGSFSNLDSRNLAMIPSSRCEGKSRYNVPIPNDQNKPYRYPDKSLVKENSLSSLEYNNRQENVNYYKNQTHNYR